VILNSNFVWINETSLLTLDVSQLATLLILEMLHAVPGKKDEDVDDLQIARAYGTAILPD
jgi:hypothetical protein